MESSNSKYQSVSISYQPDLFLTDRYSQDFHILVVTILNMFLKGYPLEAKTAPKN